ncbi:MAG: sensor histidine kinase [Bacillota bacterium]
MRSRSLVAKLWLAFTALLLFVLIPLEFALHHVLVQFYATQVTEPLLYHSRQLAFLLAEDEGAIHMAPMMGQMVGGEVIVLDRSGRPVRFEGASPVAPPEAGVAAIKAGKTFVGQLQTPGRQTYIVTGVPVPNRGGGVLLMAPAAPVQQSLLVARRYLWLAGAVSLVLGTGLALMLARSLTRPIQAMERVTRSIARGDFTVRVPVESQDEIGRLGEAVNQMTAQLHSYENRRREFLANVAHELRTPLSYIRGYTQALAEGIVTDPAERERYQRVVLDESVRIGRLVDDLMDLAQMDEGQMAFDRQPLDLRLPVEQAAATVRPRAQAKGVSLLVELPDRLPLPLADGGRIQQVVFNLLDNALRHTPDGGSIRVTAAPDPEGITVRVTDTGEGVDPELAPLIFKRFVGRRQGGRGLGLAVVRSIVKAHGGEVGVESKPGEGSTFWFRLPLA